MVGKQFGGSKRMFIIFVAISGLFLIYLAWSPRPEVSRIYRDLAVSSINAPINTWTYQCRNKRCEKSPTTSATPVSLETCNMLCGPLQIWPHPTGSVKLASTGLSFDYDQIKFKPNAREPAMDFLKTAIEDFRENIAVLSPNAYLIKKSDIDSFSIVISIENSEEVRVRLNTNESYKLTVKLINERELVANLSAKTFFGARHGLETLSQLIWFDEDSLKIIKGASVDDGPTFPYRGLMIDTARNYIPVDHLKKSIRGMAANKLNVFHWHVTDSQSFPLVSPSVPKMSKYGAYGPDKVYTEEDVRFLVDFARRRGIRVIMEIDAPAHVGNGWNWGPEEGLGDLAVCVNQQPWHLYCGEPPCGQLNPTNPNTYDILEKLYKDILDLTGEDEIFHLGGDEVNMNCWSSLPHTTSDPITSGSLMNPFELWGEFTVKALQKLKIANGGKDIPNVVLWSSHLVSRPYNVRYLNSSNTVVQVWSPFAWDIDNQLISDNFRIIASHVDTWYLDCGFGRWTGTSEAACDPYRPWQSIYLHRPWNLAPTHRKMYLGAEVCLWTEQVVPEALDGRLWPRASAFAERVWSDPNFDKDETTVQEYVFTRMSTQRERMVKRGFNAEAMWPEWCSQNPGQCL